MGGGAYTQAVKVPKGAKKMDEMSSKEKMKKGLYKEDMGGEDGLVQITLEADIHTVTGGLSYDIGNWAASVAPQLAKFIQGEGSREDLGNAVAGLATAGTAGVTTGLAMYADDIKKAAKIIKDAAKQGAGAVAKLLGKGGKKNEADMGGDSELEAFVAKAAK